MRPLARTFLIIGNMYLVANLTISSIDQDFMSAVGIIWQPTTALLALVNFFLAHKSTKDGL